MSKYIELSPPDYARPVWITDSTEVDATLEWLGAHSDQVPGRTITESEYDRQTITQSSNFGNGFDRAMVLFGNGVTPDPEPTNAEKLAKEILASFNRCEFDFESSFEQMAKALDARGVKAGGDDE